MIIEPWVRSVCELFLLKELRVWTDVLRVMCWIADGWMDSCETFGRCFSRMPKSLGEFLKKDGRCASLGHLAKRKVEEESEPFIEEQLGKFVEAEKNLVCGGDDT